LTPGDKVSCPVDFNAKELKKITERGHSVIEVVSLLGITEKSLYRRKADIEQRSYISLGNESNKPHNRHN
jgi:hypothetical protein